MHRPPFPAVIDSSMRGAFANCPRQFYWQYLRHLRKPGGSIHLHAGGAFARGCEVARKLYYNEGLSGDAAIAKGALAALEYYGEYEAPLNHVKSPENVVKGLMYYFTKYPFHTDHCQPLQRPDGTHSIEHTFAIPLEFEHPETGDPLIYAGRNDMVVKYNEMTFVFDDKTATQLGASWPNQWDLRAQLTGYTWAARQTGYPDCQGAIIRACCFRKSGFDTAESLQLRANFQIERWVEQLYRDIERMILSWRRGEWDYNFDSACSSYGGCTYLDLCKVEDPEPWIETDFEVSEWSPLTPNQ